MTVTEQSGRPKVRVAIVEDHLLQRQRTQQLLTDRAGFEVVFSGSSLPEFVDWAATVQRPARPHLLVLDLLIERAPSVDPDVVRRLIEAGLRILVLSALASPSLVRAVTRAGVTGIVGKRDSEERILEAAREVLRGGVWMTPELAEAIAADPQRPSLSAQEERALVLYASGCTTAETAEAMGVGAETVKQYLQRVRKKYAERGRPVSSKVELARFAWLDGFVDPDA